MCNLLHNDPAPCKAWLMQRKKSMTNDIKEVRWMPMRRDTASIVRIRTLRPHMNMQQCHMMRELATLNQSNTGVLGLFPFSIIKYPANKKLYWCPISLVVSSSSCRLARRIVHGDIEHDERLNVDRSGQHYAACRLVIQSAVA